MLWIIIIYRAISSFFHLSHKRLIDNTESMHEEEFISEYSERRKKSKDNQETKLVIEFKASFEVERVRQRNS